MCRKNNRTHTTEFFLAITVSLMVILSACASPAQPPVPTPTIKPADTATVQPKPTVVPTAAPTRKPTESSLPPQACAAQGKLTYTHPADRYCFAYPARFKLDQAATGQPALYGPALDASPDPLRASLTVEVEVAARDKSLTQIVDDYVSQFAGLPVPPIQRARIQLGGEPAEQLEVVPGREGSRDVFVLRNGTLFHLMFMPSVRDFPQAAPDVENLFNAVTSSFKFLSAAGKELTLNVNVNGVAQSFTSQVIAAVPASAGGPYWEVMPQYNLLTLMGYPITNHQMKPQIFIYPANDLVTANEGAGQIAANLQTLLQNQQAGENLPFLPLFNAKQAMHAQVKYQDFKNGKGVRYLTQFNQGPVPINNHYLIYTFQGLTSDGKYYIAAVLPVANPELPASPEISAQYAKALSDNPDYFPDYLSRMVTLLNQQPASAFTPDLSKLDTMIQSIEIE